MREHTPMITLAVPNLEGLEIHVALTAIGVCAGDLVIFPIYTFITTANAMTNCKAVSWLEDYRWGIQE